VDEVSFEHPENGRTYRRVPEVIDCWFDSGAMSYAQWHYPFENRELFQERFPADYICEAIDQTRGWFYTLHAIATLVSDSVAFRNCVCLAHIVDKDGKKMSKSLGNIVNPYDVFDSVGADALRWYLAARIAPEAQKRISVELVADVASTFINTFWNTYGFFVLYARLDQVDLDRDVALEKRPEIDRWALALLQHTTETVTNALESYDARGAGMAIESFVDQLSNWYVRRNRRRFWKAAAGDDKQSAYLTLYECLHVVHRLMAPLMPFLPETIYQNLVRTVDSAAPMSVHMADWPEVEAEKQDQALIGAFDVVQRVVGLGRSARNNTRLRVRQPLKRLLVRVPDVDADAVKAHADQILEELNVKNLELVASDASLVSYRLKPNLPRIGKRFGKRIPAVRAALAQADAGRIASRVAAGESFDLAVDGESIAFEPEDVLVESVAAEGYACAEEGGYLVGLDTRLDAELVQEGLARELVRTVQEARKQAGLEVSDRIVLRITGSPAVEDAVAAHRAFLMDETLASAWGEDGFKATYTCEHSQDDVHWKIELTRDA
jgi:isoleucyl-tRNA synthetase